MLHWLPENISTYGHRIDGILQAIAWIVGVWFLLVEAVLFYFLIRYRRRPGVSATYQPGTKWRPLLWLLVPAILILGFDLGIDFMQGPVWTEIKQSLPQPDQTIRIKGRQFVWEFTHPGRDGRLDTADDILATNQLTVPINTKIQFELQSADVIHSLWIPNLRLKQDAVPGRTIPGWFEATKEGTFPVACAELCGSGHGVMKGEMRVLNAANYQKWLEEETKIGSR
ncbi:MAG: cytochrome c oxidase subunit II [Deltaproteobacteria bacterium]|nr:cytochrome c oxidase subunit II [Deltaproteobacteria bacterium]